MDVDLKNSVDWVRNTHPKQMRRMYLLQGPKAWIWVKNSLPLKLPRRRVLAPGACTYCDIPKKAHLASGVLRYVHPIEEL